MRPLSTRSAFSEPEAYGVLGTASKLKDSEASNEVLHIYNDWLKDFCSHYPDRQIGLACLPYASVEQAAQKIRRAAMFTGVSVFRMERSRWGSFTSSPE